MSSANVHQVADIFREDSNARSLISDPGTSQSPLLGERLTFKSPLTK